MVVPAVILVLGIAVVIYGALHDRSRRERARAALTEPPRPIPGFSPSADPHYLLGPDAHQRATPLPKLTSEPAVRDSGSVFEYGLLSGEFATHDGGLAFSESTIVLVLDAPPTSIHDLLPTLTAHATEGTLAIVAPEFPPEIADTLAVNVVQSKLSLIAVPIDDAEDRHALATVTDATPIDAFDLQAGYVPPDHLGHAAEWLSDRTRTWILPHAEA